MGTTDGRAELLESMVSYGVRRLDATRTSEPRSTWDPSGLRRFAETCGVDRVPSSAFPMWIFDRRSGAILAVNDAAVQAYGYTLEQLLACCVDDLCVCADSEGASLRDVRSESWPWVGRSRHVRNDGTTFEAELAMIEDELAHDGMVLVQPRHAVPDERAAEEAPAPMSRTRSKTLLGRAKLLTRAPLPSSRGQSAEHVRRQGIDASRESQLLAHERAFPCNPTSFVAVEARELAQRARERVLDLANAKAVDVVIQSTCGPVWVEPEAFSVALYELVDNAVRATRRHCPVVIDVRDTSGGDVLWQIRDAGDGMSDRVLVELGRWPHRLSQGSGLGVALAWTIVEKHGGLLRFESALGMGTTASIWLPGRR